MIAKLQRPNTSRANVTAPSSSYASVQVKPRDWYQRTVAWQVSHREHRLGLATRLRRQRCERRRDVVHFGSRVGRVDGSACRDQHPHRDMVAAQHRERQRRAAPVVGGVDVGAEFDEQRQHVVIRLAAQESDAIGRGEGRVHRGLPVLESRPATTQRCRVVGDHATHEGRITQRHRGEDMVPRAAFEQQIDHRLVARARGPADHVALVKVAPAVHVGAGIEQDPHALEKAMRSSEVQGRHVVAVFAGVRVRAMRDSSNCTASGMPMARCSRCDRPRHAPHTRPGVRGEQVTEERRRRRARTPA